MDQLIFLKKNHCFKNRTNYKPEIYRIEWLKHSLYISAEQTLWVRWRVKKLEDHSCLLCERKQKDLKIKKLKEKRENK